MRNGAISILVAVGLIVAPVQAWAWTVHIVKPRVSHPKVFHYKPYKPYKAPKWVF